MVGHGRYALCIEMVWGSAIKYEGEDMSNLMTALTADERTSLFRIIGKEWDAVYKLWCYAQSRGQYALEDFNGYCSELADILDDINEADKAARAGGHSIKYAMNTAQFIATCECGWEYADCDGESVGTWILDHLNGVNA